MKDNYDFSEGVIIKGKLVSKTELDRKISESKKILTSIRLDKDLVEAVKVKASANGVGYSTWINKKLREYVLKENSLEQRVSKLEELVLKDG